jgi:pimeloyl-ACP methyl ester carboxylesterase
MAGTFVLVHPAWLGGWCWKKIVTPLRNAGHAVYTPTLTGLGDREHLASPSVTLATHIDDILKLFEFEDLQGVTLVGNSSGGTVITGVADRVAHAVRQVVYLDAFVPADGQSTRDLIVPERRAAMDALVQSEGDGWLLPRFGPPPWEAIVDAWRIPEEDRAWMLSRLRPTPWGHFTEPVRIRDEDAPFERVYVRCVDWPAPRFDDFGAAARSTAGWSYRELHASHIPFVSDADDVIDLLKDIVA